MTLIKDVLETAVIVPMFTKLHILKFISISFFINDALYKVSFFP